MQSIAITHLTSHLTFTGMPKLSSCRPVCKLKTRARIRQIVDINMMTTLKLIGTDPAWVVNRKV